MRLNVHSFTFRLYLGLMASLGVMVTMAAVPALPSMTLYFNCPPALCGWTITSAMLGAVLCQFFWGPFSDRYNRKLALYLGCLLAAASSFLCYLSPNIEAILIGRFFQGFSSGAGFIVVRAICRDIYDGVQLSRVLAFVLTVIPVVAGVTPSVSDLIVQYWGWQAPFLLLTVVVLIFFGATPIFLSSLNFSKRPTYFKESMGSIFLFFKDKATVLLVVVSSLLYMCFFLFIPSSPWIFLGSFNLQTPVLSIALCAFPLGTFFGGMFQSTWGWRYDDFQVSFWCYIIALMSLWFNLLFLYLYFSPLFYVGFMMFFGGSMSAFNSICMAFVMKRHSAAYSGNLSSFIGVGQTLGSATGSVLASYIGSPFSMISWILLLAIISFFLYLIAARYLEGYTSLRLRFGIH